MYLSGILVRNPGGDLAFLWHVRYSAQRAVAKGSAFVTACSPSASVSLHRPDAQAIPDLTLTPHPVQYSNERSTVNQNSRYTFCPKRKAVTKKIVVRFSEGEWSLLSLPPRSFSMISHRLARLGCTASAAFPKRRQLQQHLLPPTNQTCCPRAVCSKMLLPYNC